MKKITILLCFISIFSFGQSPAIKEINEQVWKPFIKSFGELDTKGFMAVHSKDVIRAPRDQGKSLNFEDYRRQTEEGNARAKQRNVKRTIELRFIERNVSGDMAYEIGIYKTTAINPDSTQQNFYGKFQVVHRKVDNVWKILVDSDSSEKNSIGEVAFKAAKPLE